MDVVSKIFQHIDVGPNGLRRRTEPRYEARGVVEVHEGGRSGRIIGTAHLRNISTSGVCVSMLSRLAAGDRVYLAGPGLNMDVIVRHSASGVSGYVIGFERLGSTSSCVSDLPGLPATW
jgi:hypothetical protein